MHGRAAAWAHCERGRAETWASAEGCRAGGGTLCRSSVPASDLERLRHLHHHSLSVPFDHVRFLLLVHSHRGVSVSPERGSRLFTAGSVVEPTEHLGGFQEGPSNSLLGLRPGCCSAAQTWFVRHRQYPSQRPTMSHATHCAGPSAAHTTANTVKTPMPLSRTPPRNEEAQHPAPCAL
jgi:hypothetical protein